MAESHNWHCLSQNLSEDVLFAKPNIFCHFTQGMGDPKYMPVPSWPALNELLEEALDSYNKMNAAMNLVSAKAALAPPTVSSCLVLLALGCLLPFQLKFRAWSFPLLVSPGAL